MEWVAITVCTTLEAEEAVNQILFSEGAKGTVIDDGNKKVTAYFPVNDDIGPLIDRIRDRVHELREFGLDIGKAEVTAKRVYDEDWANQWRESYEPIRITPNMVIKPSWKEFSEKNSDIVIQMDPGMAFGSGTHFTTKSCLVLLEKYVRKGFSVLDVGTGSGVLAIAAAKLGAEKVVALDVDTVAVEVAIENIHDNDVEDIVQVIHGSPTDIEPGEFDIVVANIVAEVIIELFPCLYKHLKKGGLFIGAGIIPDRLRGVMDAIEKEDMALKETLTDGQWVSVVYCKGIDDGA